MSKLAQSPKTIDFVTQIMRQVAYFSIKIFILMILYFKLMIYPSSLKDVEDVKGAKRC